MKVFLILALVVFTGCQASLFNADEPKPQLERLTDRIKEELNNVKCALKPYFEYVITDPIKKGVDYIRSSVAPHAESLDTETLKDALLEKSGELREAMEQRLKEIQAQLEPLTEEFQEKMNLYTRELKAQLTSFYDFYIKSS
ncbi:uncharacterized protein [Misgurnus anguillicaudatus]|uniref:uncharacterized protein n=1 Tax=Misgurnus anguillicaudatus TaxID=75329 RepID=UPI003CCFB8B9